MQRSVKKNQCETSLRPYGLGERNDRRQELVHFTVRNKLKMAGIYMYTLIKKRAGRMWIWESPRGTTKNKIDYLITDPIIKLMYKVTTDFRGGNSGVGQENGKEEASAWETEEDKLSKIERV